MREQTKIKLRKIRFDILFIKFLLNRGLALFDTPYQIVKYTAFAGILVELLNKAFNWSISLKTTIILTPFLIVVGIMVGWFDVRKLHILQIENEIATDLNPVVKKISEGIKKLIKYV